MSINITNFSIPLEDTLYCTSLLDFSIDITDTEYPITISGTYFTDNGLKVNSILSPITNGYRMIYSTIPSGNMLLVANTSNSNGDYLSEAYELQYGYEAVWEEVQHWKPLQEVPVSVMVSNLALAPNTAYFSTFFTTKGLEVLDLEVGITAEGSGNMNLLGLIKPQSTYFLQGKTYNVTISGIRDFSGNELAAITYSFTINDNII